MGSLPLPQFEYVFECQPILPPLRTDVGLEAERLRPEPLLLSITRVIVDLLDGSLLGEGILESVKEAGHWRTCTQHRNRARDSSTGGPARERGRAAQR